MSPLEIRCPRLRGVNVGEGGLEARDAQAFAGLGEVDFFLATQLRASSAPDGVAKGTDRRRVVVGLEHGAAGDQHVSSRELGGV